MNTINYYDYYKNLFDNLLRSIRSANRDALEAFNLFKNSINNVDEFKNFFWGSSKLKRLLGHVLEAIIIRISSENASNRINILSKLDYVLNNFFTTLINNPNNDNYPKEIHKFKYIAISQFSYRKSRFDIVCENYQFVSSIPAFECFLCHTAFIIYMLKAKPYGDKNINCIPRELEETAVNLIRLGAENYIKRRRLFEKNDYYDFINKNNDRRLERLAGKWEYTLFPIRLFSSIKWPTDSIGQDIRKEIEKGNINRYNFLINSILDKYLHPDSDEVTINHLKKYIYEKDDIINRFRKHVNNDTARPTEYDWVEFLDQLMNDKHYEFFQLVSSEPFEMVISSSLKRFSTLAYERTELSTACCLSNISILFKFFALKFFQNKNTRETLVHGIYLTDIQTKLNVIEFVNKWMIKLQQILLYSDYDDINGKTDNVNMVCLLPTTLANLQWFDIVTIIEYGRNLSDEVQKEIKQNQELNDYLKNKLLKQIFLELYFKVVKLIKDKFLISRVDLKKCRMRNHPISYESILTGYRLEFIKHYERINKNLSSFVTTKIPLTQNSLKLMSTNKFISDLYKPPEFLYDRIIKQDVLFFKENKNNITTNTSTRLQITISTPEIECKKFLDLKMIVGVVYNKENDFASARIYKENDLPQQIITLPYADIKLLKTIDLEGDKLLFLAQPFHEREKFLINNEEEYITSRFSYIDNIDYQLEHVKNKYRDILTHESKTSFIFTKFSYLNFWAKRIFEEMKKTHTPKLDNTDVYSVGRNQYNALYVMKYNNKQTFIKFYDSHFGNYDPHFHFDITAYPFLFKTMSQTGTIYDAETAYDSLFCLFNGSYSNPVDVSFNYTLQEAKQQTTVKTTIKDVNFFLLRIDCSPSFTFKTICYNYDNISISDESDLTICEDHAYINYIQANSEDFILNKRKLDNDEYFFIVKLKFNYQKNNIVDRQETEDYMQETEEESEYKHARKVPVLTQVKGTSVNFIIKYNAKNVKVKLCKEYAILSCNRTSQKNNSIIIRLKDLDENAQLVIEEINIAMLREQLGLNAMVVTDIPFERIKIIGNNTVFMVDTIVLECDGNKEMLFNAERMTIDTLFLNYHLTNSISQFLASFFKVDEPTKNLQKKIKRM